MFGDLFGNLLGDPLENSLDHPFNNPIRNLFSNLSLPSISRQTTCSHQNGFVRKLLLLVRLQSLQHFRFYGLVLWSMVLLHVQHVTFAPSSPASTQLLPGHEQQVALVLNDALVTRNDRVSDQPFPLPIVLLDVLAAKQFADFVLVQNVCRGRKNVQ